MKQTRSRELTSRQAEMAMLYTQGESLGQIARIYGCTAGAVVHAVDKAGVQRRPVGGGSLVRANLPPDYRDIMVSDYLSGDSAEKAASKFGLTRKACLNALKEKGIKPRHCGDHCRISLEAREKIIKMYFEPMSAKEIGAKLGLQGNAIRKCLKDAGVPVRRIAAKNPPVFLRSSFCTKEYQKWRRALLRRDGGKCRMCGASENLHSHHIFPVRDYPHLFSEVQNGIILCSACHRGIASKEVFYAEKFCAMIGSTMRPLLFTAAPVYA